MSELVIKISKLNIRPEYKKWQMTDCFGEYDYRQNTIHINMIYVARNVLIQSYMRLCMQQYNGWIESRKAALEKDEFEEA
jgi:hypothetical protein